MRRVVLRSPVEPTDDDWSFQVPNLPKPELNKRQKYLGLHISFTPQEITIDLAEFPSNRVLQMDDQDLFILASFGSLRFDGVAPSIAIEYMKSFFKKGLRLNQHHYWFYGHSNSQLRSRSCFLRRGNSSEELHQMVLQLGEFGSIKSVAKLAKRIGLLFSSATIDWNLDPTHVKDVPDIEEGETLFSDGCGLISVYLARLIARNKQVIFRQKRYTPTVFQIRYKGYKGVLMLHPDLDKERDKHVHFRKSMKKFSVPNNNTFSVVEFSMPYIFARLNNDIVTLLSSLGITDEVLLRKQQSYLDWLRRVPEEVDAAIDFLSSVGQHEDVERVLLEGLETSSIQKLLLTALKREISSFKKADTDKDKLRLLLSKSRYVFGVCDPYKLLKEGQVFVRVTMPRVGPQTIHSTYVLVVRNPCMHPGDCLKLFAVDIPSLHHLVDCVVFASQGKHAAPSLSSGGDLDGDKYTVIWDSELIPTKVSQSYNYPPVKEKRKENITRQDLAAHFAGYNSISMGRAAKLHSQWVRCRPDGAMSQECQELNALYSQCVDGAIIKIPDRLRAPPPPTNSFIVDKMLLLAKEFATEWLGKTENATINAGHLEDRETLKVLLSSTVSMSEYQVLDMAIRIAKRSGVDLASFLPMMNFSALSAMEKRLISNQLSLTVEQKLEVWNSLMRSDLLSPRVFDRDLSEPPLRLQRLYTTAKLGCFSFFEYLKRALSDYQRRLIIIKTDDRFAAGIFVRGLVEWDDDAIVNDNVLVFALTPNAEQTMSKYKATVAGYRLHCTEGSFQLYAKAISNTWIYMAKAPSMSQNELLISVALDKISAQTQRYMGRINKTPVIGVEIHVVSNRDRVAQQIFDLRYDRVATEEKIRLIAQKAEAYARNSLKDFDWKEKEGWKEIFTQKQDQVMENLQTQDAESLHDLMEFALRYHEEERAFWIFNAMLTRDPPASATAITWLAQYPHLVFNLLHSFLPSDGALPNDLGELRLGVLEAVVNSANDVPMASLVALEKLQHDIGELDVLHYAKLIWLASITVRARQTFQEILLVLSELREKYTSRPSLLYTQKQLLHVAFERAEEAFENCRCDAQGRPTMQRRPPLRVDLHRPRKKTHPTAVIEPNNQVQEDSNNDSPEHFDRSTRNPIVVADIRVDTPSTIRLHSHVRLTAASKPEKQNALWKREILDGVVKQSFRGEAEIELYHFPPPEYESMKWNLYDAGSTATARAVTDAIIRLESDKYEACAFHAIITGSPQAEIIGVEYEPVITEGQQWSDSFNESQRKAIASACISQLSLIWGPPGTGKTTVVVKILEILLSRLEEGKRILMTASTHNAVDNVLERFALINSRQNPPWLTDEEMVRAATDHSKVAESVKKYTVDALIGGSPTDDPKLVKKAEKRIKEAKIVFTTCAGAGLGVLRKQNFDIVLIDEASQITEGIALIPLVKGARQAVLVGDHVQLRPTVKGISSAIESDVSLFERLYVGPDYPGMSKSMLEVQYRFPSELARFPSKRFYADRLGTGTDISSLAQKLKATDFPWPMESGSLISNVFVPCKAEEDYGGQSKQNSGQAHVVKYVESLLNTERARSISPPLTIAVLTPYTKQVTCIKSLLSSTSAIVSTVDGFQGREADFIIYSSVRCNPSHDIGFLMDERRLNVAWTRARLGRIVVGDEETLKYGTAVREETAEKTENELWSGALRDCCTLHLKLPDVVA